MDHGETQVSVLFSRDAAGYDELRRHLIPCFDEFYGTALELIREWQPAGHIDILDIGAGTGLFSALIRTQCPEARFCLLDASARMLEQARGRFLADNDVEYRRADMANACLGGPWDLVISALAIHHLDDEQKRHLYRRIRLALKPGGLFVNAEQISASTPSANKRYAKIWLEQIIRAGVPEGEIDKARERMSHDKCASVGDQLRWIREAGFVDVDCSFKAWQFAVLSGRA